jgi:hypothetical protein
MLTTKIDARVLADPSWWHWALTVPLLAAHLAAVPKALAAAMVLCGIVGLFFFARLGSVRLMPVQVRLAYLALLALGLAPGMGWLHWVQLVGTSAMVTFGYCPLVRLLTLLPWNRGEPLSSGFLKALAFAPAAGGLWRWRSLAAETSAACSCSLAAAARKQAPAC